MEGIGIHIAAELLKGLLMRSGSRSRSKAPSRVLTVLCAVGPSL